MQSIGSARYGALMSTLPGERRNIFGYAIAIFSVERSEKPTIFIFYGSLLAAWVTKQYDTPVPMIFQDAILAPPLTSSILIDIGHSIYFKLIYKMYPQNFKSCLAANLMVF